MPTFQFTESDVVSLILRSVFRIWTNFSQLQSGTEMIRSFLTQDLDRICDHFLGWVPSLAIPSRYVPFFFFSIGRVWNEPRQAIDSKEVSGATADFISVTAVVLWWFHRVVTGFPQSCRTGYNTKQWFHVASMMENVILTVRSKTF